MAVDLTTAFERLVGHILAQHELFFPKATVSTQMEKLSEEMNEFLHSTSLADREDEGGDVLYVIISLLRFPEIKSVTDFLLYNFYYSKEPKIKKNLIRILERTANKVSDRYSKGVYYWTGTHYERDKSK